jgi:hypothetical protein
MPTREEILAGIQRTFAARGIDPAIATRVLQAESGLNPAARNVSPREESYGLGQLNVKGGLGVEARRRGIEPSDPAQWERQLEFIADQVAKGGWGPWHAARRVGIGNRQGVGTYASAAPAPAMPTAKTLPTEVTGVPAAAAFNVKDLSKLARYNRGQMGQVGGLILHHTGGHGTPEGVISTLNQRGLGVHYVMDRDGQVYRTLPQGARGAHIRPSERGEIPISNKNALGIEVIAKDDRDITDAQKAAIRGFRDYAAKTYGFDPNNVYGHGHINSHKQATEGATLLAALKGETAPALPTTGMAAARPAADPNTIPTLPANPARGILADNPMQPVVDAAKERQEAQTQQMEAMQASLAPQPAAPAPLPQPPPPIAPTPEAIGLLLPRLRRGLLAAESSGILGA